MAYNGWTNHETWLYYTWLSNEASAYKDMLMQADLYKNDAAGFTKYLKTNMKQHKPKLPGIYGDLLRAAINKINFSELAVKFLEFNKPLA